MQPFIKWAGGKRWLVNDLEPIVKQTGATRLVEPFCGALGVSLGLEFERVLANDMNPALIGLYRGIKRGEQMSLHMTPNAKRFDRYRRKFNKLYREDPYSWETAQLFYYLLKCCFNGLCRFNKSGEFNVSLGSYTKVDYGLNTESYRKMFRRWVFKSGDFTKLKIDASDFILIDPPYDDGFVSYTEHGFDWVDQERTAVWAASHGVPVVCTNAATERILRLYTDLGFDVRYIEAPRRISSDGDRNAAQEMIAFKNCEPIEGLKKCRMRPKKNIKLSTI